MSPPNSPPNSEKLTVYARGYYVFFCVDDMWLKGIVHCTTVRITEYEILQEGTNKIFTVARDDLRLQSEKRFLNYYRKT
ncbi:hypothetical protein BT69DRAFT_1286747 [Atractiella rhizophila]|nr:hypothetical protein BT69DRAFT_1286747 [Atractiella rhizophila]